MTLRIRTARLAALIASAALAGCLPETQNSAQPAPQPSEELPNTAPTITGAVASSATAGTPWQLPFAVNDVDDDPLVVTATGLPAWASLDTQAHLVSGTPALTDVGTTGPIVLTVTDGRANSTLAAFTITVVAPPTIPAPQPAPEPDPEPQPEPIPVPPPPPPSQPTPTSTAPTISGAPATTVQATRPYSFRPNASDAQTPQSLSFSITNKPAWASFSNSTGTLSGTPSASQVGTYGNIRISVSDGSLSSSLPTFSITVTAPPNREPSISGSPATSVAAGTAYSFRPSASDPDGQRLTYSISNRPAWASFSTATGRLSGTPTTQHVGTTANIVIRVSDGTTSAALPAFSIRVTAPTNRPPTISGTPSGTGTIGTTYRFRPSATDPDGDELAWSISGRPQDASFSTVTGELSFTPTAAGAWSDIVITVTDPSGAEASLPAFSITVSPPAQTGSAELSWSPPTQYTDGSALPAAQIAAYRIYHGSSAGNLGRVAEVDSGSLRFTVSDLAAGTHYFAVTTVTDAGVESSFSGIGSKTIQ